jgi:hypothetical protein
MSMTLQILKFEQKIPKAIYSSMHTTFFCGVNAHREKKIITFGGIPNPKP